MRTDSDDSFPTPNNTGSCLLPIVHFRSSTHSSDKNVSRQTTRSADTLPPFSMFRNRGQGTRRGTSRFEMNRLHAQVKQIASQVQGQGVKRVRRNAQILSVPSHNYQLKMRKTFRIAEAAGTATTAVTTLAINTNVVDSLGFAPSSTTGMTVTVHGFKVYAISATNEFATLTTQVLDIEESAGTAAQRTIAMFEDLASHSGIAHVAGIFAVNNRPTWNNNTTAVTLLNIASANNSALIIDLDLTIIRTPPFVPTFFAAFAPSVEPVTEAIETLNLASSTILSNHLG
jgi:hypothetical protein